MTNYPTSISLSPEAKRKVKAYAQARGWALSKLIEYVILEWLKVQEKKK